MRDAANGDDLSLRRRRCAGDGRRGATDTALTDVDGIFRGDEALAEEDLHAADGALLDEAGRIG